MKTVEVVGSFGSLNLVPDTDEEKAILEKYKAPYIKLDGYCPPASDSISLSILRAMGFRRVALVDSSSFANADSIEYNVKVDYGIYYDSDWVNCGICWPTDVAVILGYYMATNRKKFESVKKLVKGIPRYKYCIELGFGDKPAVFDAVEVKEAEKARIEKKRRGAN